MYVYVDEMLLLLALLLVQWRVIACVSSPTFEDNMVPTDEEVFSDLINSYRGQPEQEITLNLPTDEDALNEIKPILRYGNPFYNTGTVGRFIPFSFPEIDSRGFHESVFDDLDDLYSVSRRGKRHDSSADVDSGAFTDGFDLSYPNHKFYRYNENTVPSHYSRGKRWTRTQSRFTSERNSLTGHKNDDHSSNLPVRVNKDISNYTTAKGLFGQISNETKYNLKNDTTSGIRQKRAVPQWSKRKPEMTANGFHGDIFGNLNEFETLRKRKAVTDALISSSSFVDDVDSENDLDLDSSDRNRPDFDTFDKRVPEMDKGGFHNDVFHNNFGNFHTLKRAPDMGQSGFHGDIFHKSFGDFNPLKRAPEMSQIGFHNDVFHNSFGNFETLRKRKPAIEVKNFNNDAFNRDFGHFDTLRKRKSTDRPNRDEFDPDIGSYDRDFGNFYAGKRIPKAGAVNGDAFHSNFGIFETLKKRRPGGELTGDAFHRNFGNFDTMKRTLAGDAFHSQFGKFETMKRSPNEEASRFANDNFQDRFGNFNTLKRSSLFPEGLNNYVEVLNKVRPHRFDKLRYFSKIRPQQDETNYDEFRTFFQNYARLNKYEDMTKRLQSNDSSAPLLEFVKHNSSFTH